jgi:hypothetical protein
MGGLVEPDPPLALLPGDHHPDAPATQMALDLLTAVALVSRYPIRSETWMSSPQALDRSSLHQRLEHDLLVALSSRQQQNHGFASSLSSDVDLGPKAALAPPECLVRIPRVVDPPFCAAAACWWARIMVPST